MRLVPSRIVPDCAIEMLQCGDCHIRFPIPVGVTYEINYCVNCGSRFTERMNVESFFSESKRTT